MGRSMIKRMPKTINMREINNIFIDFIKNNNIKTSREENFEGFLRFLEIDFYDWIKENLRSYFRK